MGALHLGQPGCADIMDLVGLEVEGCVVKLAGGLEEDRRGVLISLYSRVGEGYNTYLRDGMIDGNQVVEVISGRVIERKKVSEAKGKIASLFYPALISPASLGTHSRGR